MYTIIIITILIVIFIGTLNTIFNRFPNKNYPVQNKLREMQLLHHNLNIKEVLYIIKLSDASINAENQKKIVKRISFSKSEEDFAYKSSDINQRVNWINRRIKF